MFSKVLKYGLLVLLFCYAGQATRVHDLGTIKNVGSSTGKFYETQTLAQNDQDEEPAFNKRYKAKGLQVITPLITSLTFKKFRIHSEVLFVVHSETCSSFLYCTKNKRGPPSLIS